MSGNASSKATWKRSSCDRCRSQKLRCDRNNAGLPTDACLRCSKSQADCVTSSTRPTGRPSTRNQGRTSSIDSNVMYTSVPSDHRFSSDMGDIATDVSFNSFLNQIVVQSHDFSTHEDLFSDLLTSRPTQGNFSAPGSLLQQSYQPGMHQPTTPEQQIPTHMETTGLQLSEIHYELSKQLYAVKMTPWEVKTILELKLSDESDSLQTHLHPLACVANTSSKLSKLLSSQSISLTSHATHLLTALTCYILVVSIYDAIFSRVLDWLVMHSNRSSFSQSPSPAIYLGGLQVPPSQTPAGNMLVVLAKHQLHPIEELMGLPDHFRISSRSDETVRPGETGLLQGSFGQTLLNAIMKQGEDRETRQDDIVCVHSLKKKMSQIKTI